MMYLDRNNLPPTFGHWMRVEREEGKGEGEFQTKKRLALKLLQEQFSEDYVAQLTELSLEEVKKLRESTMN
ncbi:hypothetical protein [Bacillus chungangensis]|uniref:Transposase/invertase (TIGR01784 family) n=1 Tax=Bacillus chungangensis TaxID=587633 RepID=A0ABT9WSI6_9BACI|nr:hypothetical protein [Bacillus chungangensis]MDQ0176263.1 putative transposase/invertase (TIGR01784 family) [Bacillus chungangensis]